MLIQHGMVMEMKWSTVCEVVCCVKSIVCHPTLLHVLVLFHLLPCCFISPPVPLKGNTRTANCNEMPTFLFIIILLLFCNDAQQNDVTDIKQEVKTQADNLSFFLALCSEHFVLYMWWIFAFGFFKTKTCCTSSCINCTLVSLKRVSRTLYLENKYLTQEPTLLFNTVDSLQ